MDDSINGDRTLFGEMVLRFSAHPENVATEALLYLLQRHRKAWPAVRRYLARTGVALPEDLTFETQAAGEDMSQPDMAGYDQGGNGVLLLEAKFWAGLTENQPVTYLRSLPADVPSLLVFVCPGKRFVTLWPKLTNRCNEGGIALQETTDVEAEFRSAELRTTSALALVSWAALLDVLGREARLSGDRAFGNDVEQFQGLCARVDGEAFMPLTDLDLSPEMARRIQNFADLVDMTVAEMSANHDADATGLTTGGSQSEYGRYFRYRGLGLFIVYSPRLWLGEAETPIWLRVAEQLEDGWRVTPKVLDGLARLPSRCQRPVDPNLQNVVSLDLPLGVERPDVIDSLIEQIKEICDCVVERW